MVTSEGVGARMLVGVRPTLGDLAHLVERRPCMAKVSGSSPLVSTRLPRPDEVWDVRGASLGGRIAPEQLAALVGRENTGLGSCGVYQVITNLTRIGVPFESGTHA